MKKHLLVKISKWYILLFLFILILAFFLRSNIFLHGDFYYLIDQARDLMLVKEIAIFHKLPLIGARSGLGGIFHGPLWLYMLVPSFLLTHGNPFWTLIPIFLIVSLSIVLLGFYVFYRLYGVMPAIIVAFLLAINQSLLTSNLMTTNAQVMPVIFLLYFWGIIEYMRGKGRFIMLSLLAIGLGFQFESAFSIFLLPLTLVAIRLSKQIPKSKYILGGLLLFLISVANFLLFEVRHQFLMTHSALSLFMNKVEPIKGYEQYSNIGFRVMDRLNLLQEHFLSFLFQKDILSVLLAVSLQIFAVILVLRSWRKHKKLEEESKEYLFLLIIPFLYYGLYILYPMPLWPHYLLTVDVIAVLFVGLSIKIIWGNRYAKALSVFFFALLCFQSLLWLYSHYLQHPYTATTDGSYKNQLRVAEAVIKETDKKKVSYFEYSAGILTYQMDYLMWYLGSTNKKEISNTKESITYLIMYPTPGGDKSAHEFWKKNTVRTSGKVLFHRVYPGGIVLEKLAITPNEPPADTNYYQGLLFR